MAYQTLHVLGSQKLSDLRDAICCVSDLQVFGEFSNTPDMVPQFISKDHYKSAFFFFNGTFFNDTRFPECQDISKTTREWTRTRDFPEFKTAKMEDTSFYDLKMKVGFPYLYTHQGDCEHVVILTDVRSALPHFMLIFPRLHTHFFLKLLKMFLKFYLQKNWRLVLHSNR
uniref:snRNA-activating protein complex subunit 3 n=1 Tax=Cyprinus carpio TaxID=7962 RepID=A0A8C1QXI3_CYPCA